MKSHLLRRMLCLAGIIHIDGARQLAIATYCVRTFFDANLKNPDPTSLKISSPLYPEIHVLTK
jgi:hypothetical protein